MSEEIKKDKDNQLAVCFQGDRLQRVCVDGIVFYMVPKFQEFRNITLEQRKNIEFILEDFNPDVITVFGTEHFFQTEIIKLLNRSKYASKTSVWIQGLVGIYATHYFAGLPEKLSRRKTIKEFITGYTMRKDHSSYVKRGVNEKIAIENVKNIFGRTKWDYGISKQYSPDSKYYFCNETLRGSFYSNQWNLEHCERYSIFVSQCQSPIKGFHIVLEALVEIRKKYPNVHLYTTGRNLSTPCVRERLRFSTYEKYIYRLIKEKHLQKCVTFLGRLSEEQMCERYLKSHVFVSASSIENSPNSVGEAMLLGVPTISSYVGGVADLLKDGEEGYLYQADAPYMLAHYVDCIFSNDSIAETFAVKSRAHATITHNRKLNYETLIISYREILGKEETLNV